MTIEKIDQASDKADSYNEVVDAVIAYINSKDQSLKERLSLERKIRKYQDGNTSDWLLNLILSINKKCQTLKENK